MARFSIGTAFGDAFRLIGRRPLSVFIWGLLVLLPNAAIFLVMLPMMGEIIASGEAGMEPDFGQMMQFQGLNGLLNLVQIVITVVVYTAVMRAVVRPAERSFFSLRLGMDELRVAVVGIAVFVGVYMAMIVLVLLGAAIGFAVWQLQAPGNWMAISALVLVLILGVWLMMARVSLIAPASVLHRDFAFVQGWQMGRGQTWSLFGMMLLQLAIVLVIELALAVAVVMTLGLGSAFGDPQVFAVWFNPANWGDPIPWLTSHWPWVIPGGVVLAFIYGLFLCLGVGPFASACRQLVDSSAAAPVSGPEADTPPAVEPAPTPEL
ncbi:MAG: hypothetical protein ACOH1H_10785 [Brevundimonas sp.]